MDTLFEEAEIDSRRIDLLCDGGLALIDEAQSIYGFERLFVGISGGNDSVATAYLASQHKAFAGCFHIVTGIGIRETAKYVERLCDRNGWPLRILKPPKSYRDLVLRWGFPGPAMHGVFYRWLKDRCIEELVRSNKTHRLEHIGIVTGARKLESKRRFGNTQRFQKKGSQLWMSPLFEWNKFDVGDYLLLHEAEKNPVVEKLGFSGECLCGAYAQPGELEVVKEHYPEEGREIEELQEDVAIAGKHCIWGTRPTKAPSWAKNLEPGPLCAGCVSAQMAEETLTRLDFQA
jgi:3'-phosphoadenosine 5'-phosphosulfate sulfotransferase (PAPS reductase)/FAD synthetase